MAALRATFLADFSNFETAVAKAELSLKSFEGSAAKVGTSINRVADSFSGRKIISEATVMTAAIEKMGGVSGLTEKELRRVSATVGEAAAKMKAMGVEVPAGMQKLADATKSVGTAASGSTTLLSGMAKQLVGMFTVGAVVAFSRELLRMGDDIVRTADRTGLFTDEVQRLSFIAKQSGNSLDELVGAIGQMQNRLASGDKSAVAAVKALNISFAELRAAGPFQQLQLIAEAIAKIPDPAGRAQVAMDLFGRTGIAILPTLQSEFKKLGDAAPVMSEKTVRSLDQAGDALDKFQLQIKVWAAESYNALGSFFDKFTGLTLKLTASFLDVSANIFSLTQKIPGASRLFPDLARGIQDVRDRATHARDAAQQLSTMTVEMGTQVRKATPLFTALGDELKKTEAAEKKAKTAQEELAEAIAKTRAAIVPLTAAQKTQVVEWNKFGVSAETAGKALGISGEAVKVYIKTVEDATKKQADFEKSVKVFGGAVLNTIPQLTTFKDVINGTMQLNEDFSFELMASQVAVDDFGHAIKVNLVPSLKGLGGQLDQQRLKFSEFSESVKASLERIPKILQDAFTGGGGMVGALKAIGVEMAEAITVPIIAGLTKIQKQAVSVGATAATALGGSTAGGMGATVAGIASSLGGAALAASAWGTSMAAAGVAGSVALGAATLGIGAAAVGVVMLVKKWKDHAKEVQENTKKIEEFQQSIWATLTPMQAIEAAGRPWAATVIGVRDAYLATGRSVEEAERDVKAMWDSTTKGAASSQAAIDRVNQAFVEQRQFTENLATGMQQLQEAAARYNITVEEMGPAWQRQQLDKQAQALFRDYELLTGSGAEHVIVLGKMAKSVNAYIHEAIKMGSEVPEAMRPMLQRMVDMGVLTDASGKKFDTLEASGLTFAITMSEGFKSLIAEVQKLTDAITKGLGLAIKNVPDGDFEIKGHLKLPKNIPKEFEWDFPVNEMAAGGRGRVTKPTLFLAGEAGPEDVAFSGANKRFAGASATGPAISVTVNAPNAFFRDRASITELAHEIGDVIMEEQRARRRLD